MHKEAISYTHLQKLSHILLEICKCVECLPKRAANWYFDLFQYDRSALFLPVQHGKETVTNVISL